MDYLTYDNDYSPEFAGEWTDEDEANYEAAGMYGSIKKLILTK
jgi:hypothetical protein